MSTDEALRDTFFALFGLVVLFHACVGLLGILGLRRLRVGQTPPAGRSRLLGFRALPNEQMNVALGPQAVVLRRAVAWGDVCASLVGVVATLLAIPVAVALPISSTYSAGIARGAVLVCTAFAFSGAGSVIGRCAAMTWITPPVTTVRPFPLSRGRRIVIVLAIGLGAVDAAVTLLVAVSLATTVQTPPGLKYIVPAYVAVVLSFPVLLGVALAAEWWLSQGWRSLLRSVLSAAPNAVSGTENSFRSLAGSSLVGRTMMVGIFVGMGQSLLTGQILSDEPYFGGVADIAFVCAIVALAVFVFSLVIPPTIFTLPREEETLAAPGGLPVS